MKKIIFLSFLILSLPSFSYAGETFSQFKAVNNDVTLEPGESAVVTEIQIDHSGDDAILKEMTLDLKMSGPYKSSEVSAENIFEKFNLFEDGNQIATVNAISDQIIFSGIVVNLQEANEPTLEIEAVTKSDMLSSGGNYDYWGFDIVYNNTPDVYVGNTSIPSSAHSSNGLFKTQDGDDPQSQTSTSNPPQSIYAEYEERNGYYHVTVTLKNNDKNKFIVSNADNEEELSERVAERYSLSKTDIAKILTVTSLKPEVDKDSKILKTYEPPLVAADADKSQAEMIAMIEELRAMLLVLLQQYITSLST